MPAEMPTTMINAVEAADRLAAIAAAEFGVPFLAMLSPAQEQVLTLRHPDLIPAMNIDTCDRDVAKP